ncbi:MAG: hypothetical protein RJA59_1263 [Pseudomonadota bacterium]|jgi:hypothetical protein
MAAEELLYLLRFAIDTAVALPNTPNTTKAIALANSYPVALRSNTLRYRLGKARWAWLNDHGVYAIGSPAEIAGMPAMKGTIDPPIKK